jgi:hypothetical protein
VIKTIVENRRITHLFHFTRAENFQSIVEKGLLPLELCAAEGIQPIRTDSQRLDGTGAVCLSIQFPNYKMFYPYRINNPGSNWVVLALNPRILWEKNCAFCRENAAKTAVSRIAIDARRGADALIAMYADFDDKKRGDLNLPDSCPTNPQAEVLCLDPIEPALIVAAIFDSSATKLEIAGDRPAVQSLVNGTYFSPRNDWRHWQRKDG